MNDKDDKPNTNNYFATRKVIIRFGLILGGLILIVVVFRKVKDDYTTT